MIFISYITYRFNFNTSKPVGIFLPIYCIVPVHSSHHFTQKCFHMHDGITLKHIVYELPKCNRYILSLLRLAGYIHRMLYKIFTPNHQLLMIWLCENKINPERYVLHCVKHLHQFIRDSFNRFFICCW